MFYLILLIVMLLVYLFMMPKDIRRSMDIFVLAGFVVLIIALVVAQLFTHQTILLQALMVIGAIGLLLRSIREINKMK